MTYQQLQCVSGIHKNSLRKRLNELTIEGTVIKHKYQLPKNDLYYGNTAQYSSIPDCRHYYLLNVYKDETKELLNHHYILDELDDAIYEIKAITEKTRDHREREKLNSQWRTFAIAIIRNSLSTLDGYKRLDEIKAKPIDAPTSIERRILKFERAREFDLACVPFRHRVGNMLDKLKFDLEFEILLNDAFLDNFIEFADHITRFRYSILDLIVRCCNAAIISTEDVDPRNEFAKFLLFPMVSYRQMLTFVRSTKYGKKLLQIFGVSIKNGGSNNNAAKELLDLKREEISLIEDLVKMNSANL